MSKVERAVWILSCICCIAATFFWGASFGISECREIVEPLFTK